jgi:ATP-dependent RNA helicase DeaD
VESAPEPEAATTGEADDKDQADSTSAQVDGDEPSADADAVVEAAPATEKPRRNRRGRKASKAPTLPLQPQEAEELAARPKAEGFRALGLNEQILADLVDVGYENPSPIQAAAIPVVLEGKDVIGQALTGTGKTAAFSLPALDKLYRLEGEGPVALVLCPTRELARQVHAEVTRMAGKSGARACLVYGGVSLEDQVDALNLNPHIVIGTPGRIIDHMRRRNLDTSRMGLVVLDEADQMLDIGFLPDITYILKHTPPSRQTMLFSATMPDEIKKLASDYMSNPEHLHTMPEAATVAKVDQKYIAVDQNKKTTLLAHFIEVREPKQMVVFCKTKHQTDRVAKVLKQKDLSAGAIHGDLPQSKRERTLRDFRDGSLQCLIATNVAARGLDIPSVSHVVNYDVPETPEEYVHRIGRTGRMGKDGIARTFVTPEDGQFLLEIEKHIGLLLEEEIVEGITASTATEVKRTIAAPTKGAPRLLKPIAGGIRLGRRRR